jgi:two-component system nitrogen regulation response regulator GlnG/two-component system response regulator HydG
VTDETTLATEVPPWERRHRLAPDVPVLVLIWSLDAPERVGEVLVVDTFGPGIFGRNDPASGDDRVQLQRQRPGGGQPTGVLPTLRISRDQLRIKPGKDHLQVENVGKCPLLVDGTPAQGAFVRPGQVVELRHQALFLCEMRPAVLPRIVDLPPHKFGEADEYDIIGECAATWELRARIAQLGPRGRHVLITGPSGTGKELVARALHKASKRSGNALVSRNAATFPEGLVDAELFGNIKDYPNPGMRQREGLIGAADQTTLYLDEIGELPHALQAHLLRLLDDGEYHRLGESRARRSDVRLVAATNRDPKVLKEDFAARLTGRIEVPGLDARRADIPLLARARLIMLTQDDTVMRRFLDRDTTQPRFSPELIRALVQHRWTTHVRELDRVLQHCADRSLGEFLELVPGCGLDAVRPAPKRITPQGELDPEHIRRVLEEHGWVREQAWRDLGLSSRHQLARLMKKHGIQES